jgi:nucleoside-diphosphate-sugar epimerase
MNKTIAITGATGFIGIRLVSELLREGGFEIRVLTRDKQRDLHNGTFGQGVNVFEGDIGDSASLEGFLVPGCTVINLVYLWDAGEARNLSCTHNLLSECKQAKIERLIHCSTAAVIGRVRAELINEKTFCQPVTEYGITKLKIEHEIVESAKGYFDAVILRPTSVFGINGEPLKKLADDLSCASHWKNYLKSCLFGKRRMNLVHVDNVVAALIFLIRYDAPFAGDVFIVSDDDDSTNNFVDVEELLLDKFGGGGYSLSRLPIPLIVLQFALLLLGRNSVNPSCNFAPSKLRGLGFKPKVSLHEGLVEYASWYRAKHKLERGRKVQ